MEGNEGTSARVQHLSREAEGASWMATLASTAPEEPHSLYQSPSGAWTRYSKLGGGGVSAVAGQRLATAASLAATNHLTSVSMCPLRLCTRTLPNTPNLVFPDPISSLGSSTSKPSLSSNLSSRFCPLKATRCFRASAMPRDPNHVTGSEPGQPKPFEPFEPGERGERGKRGSRREGQRERVKERRSRREGQGGAVSRHGSGLQSCDRVGLKSTRLKLTMETAQVCRAVTEWV